ncbi:protein NLRC3-like [Pocillopora verrucosa]|uniref:protein NLRC3-like n=1 Tax=Pocillopora verrucosa TaxID=203993 RepID=UPI003341FC6B
MESLRNLLITKTLSKLSLAAVTVWSGFEVVLFSIFAGIEGGESSRFRCNISNTNDNADFIKEKCFGEYEQKYIKLPVCGLVIINFIVIAIIPVIYSQCVKSRIHELETRDADAAAPGQQGSQTTKRLFIRYCSHLALELALAIFFIVLQTEIAYPGNFPSNFRCYLTKERTQSPLSASDFKPTSSSVYECYSSLAHKITFWSYFLTFVDGSFALVTFIEIVWILSRAKNGSHFMQDCHFYDDHLLSNRDPIGVPLLEISQQARNKLQVDLKSLKDDVIKGTKQLTDLKQPIRPNPGEGPCPKDLEIDQIFVNLVIHEGRAKDYFPEGRCKQPKVFPIPRADQHDGEICVENIIDGRHKNILVVGCPGIGKTILSTKLLRVAAFDVLKDGNFDVAFLIKFKRFNSVKNLNLRELFTGSETVKNLNDDVWKYIIQNPSKVLLIFDGVDEFSAKEDICQDDSGYKDIEEEKMPLQCLYYKIASRKLLPGATVITTSRPTAVSCVRQLNFDKIVEILGFSSEEVANYVKKFTEGSNDHVSIWQHLRTNINLFTFCYIPVHCFIICSCLSQLHSNGCNFPTKLTEIYSLALKISFFRHNDEYRQSKGSDDQFILTRYCELPSQVQSIFNKLGKIALLGLEEGRLTFSAKEVEGVEDCGLLHRLPDLNSPTPIDAGEAQFCFLHLTVQEFLAAKHVVDTMKNTEGLRKFVSDKINQSAWQVVMQFVAGLLDPDAAGEMSAVKMFTELLPMDTSKTNEKELMSVAWNYAVEEPITLICWPTDGDKDLALRICNCLYDHQLEQQSAVTSKIEEIGFNAVDFSGCDLAPVDCAALVHFLKNAGTIFLTLERNEISWLGCMEIQKWVDQSDSSECGFKLGSLNLSRNEIGCKGAQQLGNALKHQNCTLTKLQLSYNRIDEKGAKTICDALKENSCKLTTLDLKGNNIGDKGAKYLAIALKNEHCKLTELHLYGNDIGDNGAALLSDALRNENCRLTLLDIGDCKIRNKGLLSLRDALEHVNCKLTVLRLPRNKAKITGATYVSHALEDVNCKLTELEFAGNDLGDDGVGHLSRALKVANCKLTVLGLSGNSIELYGAQHLCDALKDGNCKLTVLDLGRNNIGEYGAACLADTLKNVSCELIKLDLAFNNVGERGAAHLADALQSVECKLTELNLKANGIGDKGAEHLTDALKERNCQLTVLILERNNVKDQGAAYISEALKNVNCKLIELNLSANNIGDEGAEKLLEAFKNENRTLTEYNVEGNNIREEQLARLWNAFYKSCA